MPSSWHVAIRPLETRTRATCWSSQQHRDRIAPVLSRIRDGSSREFCPFAAGSDLAKPGTMYTMQFVGKRLVSVPGRQAAMLLRRRVEFLIWLWLSSALACGGGRTSLLPVGLAETPTSPEGTDASASGGLLTSTPGVVRCGSITCTYGEQCCLREQGSPASNGCDSRSKTACHGTQDVRTCDETADCNPGELCCFGLWSSPPATLGSRCSLHFPGEAPTSCDLDKFIGCGSDDDCRAVSAPPCVAQRCRGDILQTCGLLPSGWCPP